MLDVLPVLVCLSTPQLRCVLRLFCGDENFREAIGLAMRRNVILITPLHTELSLAFVDEDTNPIFNPDVFQHRYQYFLSMESALALSLSLVCLSPLFRLTTRRTTSTLLRW
jgi:uncharacterized membrane protein YfhO